jgi:FtsZ-binding cell division protein ZapB
MGDADQANQQAVPTIFNDFIGADKKYKTVDDALASVPHAQSHIAKLEADNKALREQQQAIQARLDAIMTRSQPTDSGSMPAQQAAPAGQSVDFEALVEKALAKKQFEAKTQENSGKVAAELKQLYADKAESVYVAKAQELGLGVEDLNAMAAKSPKAVLALFQQNSAAGSLGTSSSVNMLAREQGETVDSLMSVLTTNPEVYYSQAHQEKLYKAIARNYNN